MDIIMRPGGSEDLPEAMLTLREEFLFRDTDNLRPCVAFWEALLDQRRAFFHVTADHSAPVDSAERIMGAALHLFITPEFADRLRAGVYPFVLLHLLDLERDGRLRVLGAQQIRDSNTPGEMPSLIMFVFAGLRANLMQTSAGIAIREQGSLFAAYSAAGYNLAEFFIEAHGPDWLARSHLQGMSIRTDNAPGLEASNLPTGVAPRYRTDDAFHPYLMGVTRDEALNPGGGAMARLFAYVPPRCRFTPPEQDLLRYALSGITDEELAVYLNLSPATVRKRWRGIYDRLNEALPEWFASAGGTPARNSEPSSGRSLEKKRRLLNYLRTHLEELRPASFSRGSASVTEPE